VGVWGFKTRDMPEAWLAFFYSVREVNVISLREVNVISLRLTFSVRNDTIMASLKLNKEDKYGIPC
jgi:hypothetical protein